MKRKRNWRCMITVEYYNKIAHVHRTLMLECYWNPLKQMFKTREWIIEQIKTDEFAIMHFTMTREGRK